MRTSFVSVPVALALALAAACGGSTSDVIGSDGGADGSAGDAAADASSAADGSADGGDASHADASRDASRDGGVPLYHRPDDSQCTQPAPAGNCMLTMGVGACMHDTDCTMGNNGRCIENMGGARFCQCTYDSCMHDTDCMSGQLCVCHGSIYSGGAGNHCITGNCRVDSDCASGFCSPSHGTSGCGAVTGYYCHTAGDLCANDSDCSGTGIQVCAWSQSHTRWECQQELLCP